MEMNAFVKKLLQPSLDFSRLKTDIQNINFFPFDLGQRGAALLNLFIIQSHYRHKRLEGHRVQNIIFILANIFLNGVKFRF